MTNQAQSISRDLREEIHHRAPRLLGLGRHTLLPACGTAPARGAVEGHTCSIPRGVGVRLA